MKRKTPYRPVGWPVGPRLIDEADPFPLGRNYHGPSYDWRRSLPVGLTTGQCLTLAIVAWAAGAVVIWAAFLFL